MPRKTDKSSAPKVQRAARPGHVKVSMWLPVETAKKIRHAAVERGVEIGQVVAPSVDRDLAGSYWVARSTTPTPRLALVELPTPPAGEGERSGSPSEVEVA